MPGSDSTALSGTVPVPTNATEVNIPIEILGETEQESEERIRIGLAASTLDGVSTRGRAWHSLLIRANEGPLPAQFASSASHGGEGAGTHNVPANISPAAGSKTALRYSVGGTASSGSDYTALFNAVEVAKSATSVDIPVTITIPPTSGTRRSCSRSATPWGAERGTR